MTQSGQGEEPSARPAREGIVLPSDGGEPLLPGMTGGPGDAPGHRTAPPPTGGPQASAPAEGQTWGRPWGPGQQQTPPPDRSGQSAQQWGTQAPPAWDAQAPGALPPEGARHQNPYAGAAGNPDPYGAAQPSAAPPGHNPYGTPGAGAPLPPEGSGAPAYGYPHGTGPGGQQSQAAPGHGYPHGTGLPPAVDAYGAPGGPYAHSPASGAYGTAPGGAPLPPAADEGATQYIPPVAADEGATQYIPPVSPAADEGATQYIPPVRPGALPPEMRSGADPEATRFLGTGPLPPAPNPDAEATQYIAPVPGGDKQPPAEFDNLFRGGGQGAEGPAGATQQMPRIEQPRPQPAYGAPEPSHVPPGAGRSRGGRSGSRVPVIAAVGIGIAVLGVGAGALLASGGGGGDEGGDNKTVAASAPATDGSASPSADPARAQAVELDKLLADSGNSRSTVIAAVADVKGCDNLSQAAKDLRDAAKQRSGLVTRLSGIEVDKLPDHAALTSALTKAWQASASADNHYAAWADQTAGRKGCKKGQARVTGQTQAGNRASGVASAEKAKAAGLWNGIARKYGLTERQPTQL
ncbi:hypothetical protein AB0I06_17960 [Streptomyces sp. NPDC050674]|uniref:hypothetical protein n=1 Tax=Streptomyces sp. NPDC050674 TaxID=3157216 RepID=UPI00341FC403